MGARAVLAERGAAVGSRACAQEENARRAVPEDCSGDCALGGTWCCVLLADQAQQQQRPVPARGPGTRAGGGRVETKPGEQSGGEGDLFFILNAEPGPL